MNTIVARIAGVAMVPWFVLVAKADLPAFNNLRYEEPSAAYKEMEAATVLDDLKFIPLNESGSIYASMGGQARVRWEYWENFGFNTSNDDDFGLLRLRLHGDVHVGEHVRVFVEVKSATATDRDLPGGRRTLDVDELEIQNAFIDLGGNQGDVHAVVRLGRQELSYGAQRLISPLDWSNTRRSWDGAKVIVKKENTKIDFFATRPVSIDAYSLNEDDNQQEFYGIYAVHNRPEQKFNIDLYLLRLDREGLKTGDEERYTGGSRVSGVCPLTGVEFDLEGGYQFGDSGDRDIEAWFFASELGYTFAETETKPRVYLGYDYASGDDNPDDDTVGTFQQLFPLGHAYLGYIDVLGRQNVIDYSQGVSFWPVEKKVQVRLDHHWFQRAQVNDAVYNVGGGVLREADAGSSRTIGSEIDLTAMWKVNRNLTAWLGYSRFFAGDFIKESGASSDIDFMYSSLQYTF